MKVQKINCCAHPKWIHTCQSVPHLACLPGQPQQNTYQQGCLLSVSNNQPLCHLIWQLRSLSLSTACSLLCLSTWVKMEFLGARFTSWFTLQQQLADAFMIRTTKLEPEKAKQEKDWKGRVKLLGQPGKKHFCPLPSLILICRASKPLFQIDECCHCYCNDNHHIQGSLHGQAHCSLIACQLLWSSR